MQQKMSPGAWPQEFRSIACVDDKNLNDISNVMRIHRNADGTLDRGQQVSVMAQENMKLAAFLLHYMWSCTLDWEVKGVQEETVCKLTGEKKSIKSQACCLRTRKLI